MNDVSTFFDVISRPRFIKPINFDGIQIIQTGNFVSKYVPGAGMYRIPEYTISNPNNLPYNKISLSDKIYEELVLLQEFTQLKFAEWILRKSFTFDDEVKEIFIPKRLKNEVSECLNNTYIMNVNLDDKPYVVTISPTGKFEMRVENIESINVEIETVVNEILEFDGEKLIPSKPIEISKFYESDSFFEGFENTLWGCFKHINKFKTFYSPLAMFYDFIPDLKK